MPIIKELWNNTISPYKNWHNKIKWFSIFIKPNKCQKKNRKTEIKEGGAYLGLPLCSPAAAGRPSQQAAQPTWPPLLCRLPPRQGDGACPTRAHRRAAPPPPSLPACPPLVALDGPDDATRRPAPLSHSLIPPPPLVLSLPTARTRPSPPLAVAVATGLPSPPRHASELRHNPLHLLVEPRTSGRPV